MKIPDIRSAVDVGCGVGTWLSVLREKGITDTTGVDGDWVDKRYLVIPSDSFVQQNLRAPIQLGRKFDLAISLEVAEHLPEADADGFVESLTSLADIILFSAAVPYQGGRGHVNEQWPDYWVQKFEDNGYQTIDFIRRRLWGNKNVTSWYRQNVLMFVKPKLVKKYNLTGDIATQDFLSLVHPERYLQIMKNAHSVGGTFKLFRRAIARRISRLWAD